MKYKVTIQIYNGETACGPYRLETIVDDPDAATFIFFEIDDRMIVMMEDLEESGILDSMDAVKIVAELISVDGDGWEDLAPTGNIRLTKILRYQKYVAMKDEREGED